MSRHRILHLRTVVGRGGGPEKTLLQAHRLPDPSMEVKLACFYPTADPHFDLVQRAAVEGLAITAIPECGPLDPRALLRFWKLLREYQPDLLHAHDYKSNVLGVLFSKALGIPCITTLHGFGILEGRMRFYQRLNFWALRRMHKVLAVSSDLIEQARKCGVDRNKLQLLHNAIDLNRYQVITARREARARINEDGDAFLVGAVGRLVPEKGFDVLIRAIAGLNDSEQPLRLVIAGEGPERRALEELITQLRCENRVRLLGHYNEVSDVLQSIDVFVLSSRREACPNVLLEAMAFSLPLVATGVADVPALVQAEESALIVEPDDPEQIVSAVARLREDAALRERLGKAARERCERHFNLTERLRMEAVIYREFFTTCQTIHES